MKEPIKVLKVLGSGQYVYLSGVYRRHMAEILPIRGKTLTNQSINQSMYGVYHPT